MELTTEAQMLLAASAVQLTFGLSEYHISHLKVVRVYPEPFYHRQTGQWFKGAVTEAGNLSISWADFLNGYADNNDNYNLGLHEMAHLLKLDAKYHRNDHFSHYINLWLQAAKPKVLMLLEGRASFLRDYAAQNPQEFFAVCVEHFFESPEAFKDQLPHLYLHTCILMSQNPLNTEGDYQLTREFIRSVR
jgi:MtfA peptidase